MADKEKAMDFDRHCERSEAIHHTKKEWIASSQSLS
jgi:hypothetical protein